MKRYVMTTFFVVEDNDGGLGITNGRSDVIYSHLKPRIVSMGSRIACQLFMSKRKNTQPNKAVKPKKTPKRLR